MKNLFSKTQTRYFFSYLSIFLITFFLFILIFQMSTDILRKNLYQQNQGNLQQTQQLIEERLDETMNILNLITTDSGIQSLMMSPNPIRQAHAENTLDFVSARKQLASYVIINSFIDQILLYNPQEDYCISPYSIHLTMQSASWEYNFETMKLNIRDLQEQMKQELTFMTIQDHYNPQEQYLMISKTISHYPSESYAIIFVNTKKILPFFQTANNPGNYYIYNEDGTLLFSRVTDDIPNLETVLQNQDSESFWRRYDYVSAKVVSPDNQFSYISILPTEQILQDLYTLEHTSFLILGLTFGIVACISFALSRLNYRPLAKLVQVISQYQPAASIKSKNEWTLILEHIDTSASNSKEQERIRDYLQTNLYSQLLYGHFQTPEELQNYLATFPVSIAEHSGYRVLVGRFGFRDFQKMETSLDTVWNLKQTVKDWLSANLTEAIIILEPSYNHIVILLDSKTSDLKKLEEQIQQLSRKVSEIPRAYSRFAISEPISALTDLSVGYEHAMTALEHRETEDHSLLITFDADKVMNTETAYFPPVLQIKLTHAVTCCDQTEVEEIFEEIYEKNFETRTLPDTEMHLLYFNLCACLLDLSNKLSSMPHDAAEIIQQCFYIREVSPVHLQKLKLCFMAMIPLFAKQSSTITESIPQQILQFIQDNLHSPDLCLTMIAQEFSLSEPYISSLVKEQAGMSFIQFVTEKRMEYAVNLIHSGQYTIAEIAEKTGYHSVNSFRKAFKKITGHAPSDYQKS